MGNNRYYLMMNMEPHIHKNDLALGFIDSDYKIRKEVLKKLELFFQNTVYDRMETLDTIIYSIKKELPAKPFLELRNTVLALMGIEQDFDQKMKQDELTKKLINSNVVKMVEESQHCLYLFNTFYDNFRWRKNLTSLPIKRDDCSYLSSLKVTQYGIQVYSSAFDFKTELEGELDIIINPLREILTQLSVPFKDALCVNVEYI